MGLHVKHLKMWVPMKRGAAGCSKFVNDVRRISVELLDGACYSDLRRGSWTFVLPRSDWTLPDGGCRPDGGGGLTSEGERRLKSYSRSMKNDDDSQK